MPYAIAFIRGGRSLSHSASTFKPPTISKIKLFKRFIIGREGKTKTLIMEKVAGFKRYRLFSWWG